MSDDLSYPNIALSRIAFGSCHSRGAVNKRISRDPTYKPIWTTITKSVKPQTFLWTGDAVYPPKEVKGDTPAEVLEKEFHEMKTNIALGYAEFIHNSMLVAGVHGTYDDHDYGGNDRGYELKGKEHRRDLYLDFLGNNNNKKSNRQGVYHSVQFGESNQMVKVIFLDTRYNRAKHCIPSVGAHPWVPQGAIVACLTRWITAGLNLCPIGGDVLGEEQWRWFEQELAESSASIHIIVSSIQILTTNPVVESWGHFPRERDRLLKMISPVAGLVLLSGDIHHAEISKTRPSSSKVSSTTRGAIIEVTSSGLTHSCETGWFGPLCKPILDLFPNHRFNGGNNVVSTDPSYFTKENFGSISIDWDERKFDVKVHNESGYVVLSTGPIEIGYAANLSELELDAVAKCVDGHLLPVIQNVIGLAVLVMITLAFSKIVLRQAMKREHTKHD